MDLKLFIGLIAADALLLTTDTLMWVLDGMPGPAVGVLLNIITVFYYVLNPLICLIWFVYVEFYIHRDTASLKKILLPMLLPISASLVLVVLSLFGKYLFYIDADNVYHRGNLVYLNLIFSLLYLLFAAFETYRYRKLIKKQEQMPIYFFMIPPVVGAFFQLFFYGLALIWPLATLSILYVFIRLQNKQLFTDHLTGLFNRRQLDRYMRSNILSTEGALLGGLMIDLDCFKKINDVYGHDAGDQALVYTSELLKKTFRKNDFIARYGGDEFIIIMEISHKADLETAVGRLRENVAQFNGRKTAPYTISLSIGYDFCADKRTFDMKDFIKHLDHLMYENKNTYPTNGPGCDKPAG